MLGLQVSQGDRQAETSVVAAGIAKGGPGVSQNIGYDLFGGGLADASTDSDHLQRTRADDMPRIVQQGLMGVGHLNPGDGGARLIRDSLAEDAGGAAREGVGDMIMAVTGFGDDSAE